MVVHVIASCITTASVICTGIAYVLKGFYKTNKEARNDYDKIEKDFEDKISELKKEFKRELETDHSDVKIEIGKLSNKIDEMRTQYVTNDNFKTYANAMSQLLQMSTDRMVRIENTLDDIRSDISEIIRSSSRK